MTASSVLACALDRWSPNIGDPTVMGWATVTIYALASVMCLRAALNVPGAATGSRRERGFWLLAAALLAFYAVNKELDLQSFATAIGRCIAKAQGWYAERRKFQLEFVAALAGATVGAMLVVFLWLRPIWRRTGLAAVGLVFVSGFILIRAIGFHHVDAMLNIRTAGLRVNWLLEIPGPLLVILGAALATFSAKRDLRTRS